MLANEVFDKPVLNPVVVEEREEREEDDAAVVVAERNRMSTPVQHKHKHTTVSIAHGVYQQRTRKQFINATAY
tara:strand:+ start:252 stop:470 length:219 start_codon:yes stop_codon:yes gene_type:complete